MSMRKIYRKIAREHGVSPKEVREEMQAAIMQAYQAELFSKVRKGQVRVLLGSTSKMGAGTNVQKRLAALHHLDCPWRPADIEQREGRILRQGNDFKKVKIFKYVTEGTFDAYNWGLIENKQKFIGQLMSGKNPSRSCEDVDEAALGGIEKLISDLVAQYHAISADTSMFQQREAIGKCPRCDCWISTVPPRRSVSAHVPSPLAYSLLSRSTGHTRGGCPRESPSRKARCRRCAP